MKKLLLTIIASIVLSSSVIAQGVARECVLVEAFTGIGCPYCPAAANGIAQMLEEGLSIAPLAFHNSYYSPPQYATTETNGRATYYNVNSFPTVLIDGMNRIEGGGTASQSHIVTISHITINALMFQVHSQSIFLSNITQEQSVSQRHL